MNQKDDILLEAGHLANRRVVLLDEVGYTGSKR